MTTPRISVIVGSLRRESFARKIAHEVLTMIPEGYEANIVEIRDLPLYDFDYDDPAVTDKPTPAEYTTFRETIKNSSGILFITPENNRTIPACLKNAVDIGSKGLVGQLQEAHNVILDKVCGTLIEMSGLFEKGGGLAQKYFGLTRERHVEVGQSEAKVLL